jgi:hypothetical protein
MADVSAAREAELSRIKDARAHEQRNAAVRHNFAPPTALFAKPKWAIALDAVVDAEAAARDVSGSRWAAMAAEQQRRYDATHPPEPKPEWLRLAEQAQ